ncbi:MAG: hypothetical protein LH477_00200 [Nocardioides sp.]|nr:hypothetical protein [Nocardioides sp.]
MTTVARLVWLIVVLGAGWGLSQGLWLSTYFELTEQARIDADRGELWLWGSTLVLALAALVARWSWRTPVWSGALLPAAGAVSLLASDADFLPPLVLLVVAPALLLSIGVTLVHRPIRNPSPD